MGRVDDEMTMTRGGAERRRIGRSGGEVATKVRQWVEEVSQMAATRCLMGYDAV